MTNCATRCHPQKINLGVRSGRRDCVGKIFCLIIMASRLDFHTLTLYFSCEYLLSIHFLFSSYLFIYFTSYLSLKVYTLNVSLYSFSFTSIEY